LAPGAAQAAPVTLACGDVVTQDVVLAADVECGLAQTPGLVVGADNITIDLNGHHVFGPFATHQGFPGIVNGGYDGVTIRNGSAVGLAGIVLIGASNNQLVDLDASGDTGIGISGGSGNTVSGGHAGGYAGIQIEGSPRALVIDERVGGAIGAPGIIVGPGSDNSGVIRNLVQTGGTGVTVGASGVWVAYNAGDAIVVGGGNGNVVASNWVFRSPYDGISVLQGTTNTAVAGNVAAGNTGDGINVQSASTRIVRNTAINNGDYGIEAVPGVTATGNIARGNGNPAQCLNVACASG
jgi:parallel beta-helix repeat protein